ncbi:MAG: HAD family hydrolase [Polyangiaceae bacterium]
MLKVRSRFLSVFVALALSSCEATALLPDAALRATANEPLDSSADPLPSWNDGAPKNAVLDFVARVTKEGSPGFVPVAQRIAVFDNDGTLWAEQPVPAQLAFVRDRVKELAPKHPEWRDKQPFKGVLEDDPKGIASAGERGLAELLTATLVGNTTDEFDKMVKDWIVDARHPKFHRPYTDLVYQPMLEVLAYLRANGFKTFIVSGGGADFMRPWVERVYGIPPEQVVGTRAKMKYDHQNGIPVLRRLPEADLLDDKAGKPVGIQQLIGRRPIAAFGNSDGDFEMIEWTTASPLPHLGLIVHHTDGEREFAYDREAQLATLARGLDEAPRHNWIVVDMKKDWKRVFPFQP